MTLRSTLARSKTLRAIYHSLPRRGITPEQRADVLYDAVTSDALPHRVVAQLAYRELLGRAPAPEEEAHWVAKLDSGELTDVELFQAFHAADEYARGASFSSRLLGHSIHVGRQQFIRSLPRAGRIVDLGGTHLGDESGAFVAMGYPYDFDELTIVDLPFEERHAIYRNDRHPEVVTTARGRVTYRYHSMTDLTSFGDASVDLVYSGQSFEHVTPEDGVMVLKEVFRILRPGGHLALDTPNGRVTRLQQEEFIDPDHKVEYTVDEMVNLLTGAGFDIVSMTGLNLAGGSVRKGEFDLAEVAGNSGQYIEVADCYIQCFVARRPT